MNSPKKIIFFTLFCIFAFTEAFSQEVLKSFEEEYLDFLSLTGNTKRTYLNYRTLSDSQWEISEEGETVIDPWKKNQYSGSFTPVYLDKDNFFLNGLFAGINIRPYGPDVYGSYNTEYPFGCNDGALWQGRGFNTSMSAGVRIEGFGFELTCKPQVSFSQNLDYEIMASKRGNGFGSYYTNCDAPQRFGDESFWTYDWGDSEVRWSWYGFTVGFGTESVWLGPNYVYPLLLSNNAAAFPKFDIGLRRTSITIPWVNYYLGDVEGRLVVGKLTESDYFDTDETNNNNQYVLYSFSFSPAILEGLTIGANKVCISRWDDPNNQSYWNPFYAKNKIVQNYGSYGEDQKASITADWIFPKVGAEFYAEIGIDDYLSEGLSFYGYSRYPFHTMSYTVGLQKSLTFSTNKQIYGKVNFEWNNTEPSQDYQMWGTYNFGTHSQIKQGYTNRGQWLGSGIGYGGNSQYLSFTLYSPHGFDRLFVARNNPDNAYLYGKCTTTDTATMAGKYFTAYKANFYAGLETMWFIWKGITIDALCAYNLVINPNYNPGYTGQGTVKGETVAVYREKTYLENFVFQCRLKYCF